MSFNVTGFSYNLGKTCGSIPPPPDPPALLKDPPEVLLHQPSCGLTGTGGLRGHSHYFTVWHHAVTTITQYQFWGQLSFSRDLSIATNSKTTNTTIIFLAKLVVCLNKTFF